MFTAERCRFQMLHNAVMLGQPKHLDSATRSHALIHSYCVPKVEDLLHVARTHTCSTNKADRAPLRTTSSCFMHQLHIFHNPMLRAVAHTAAILFLLLEKLHISSHLHRLPQVLSGQHYRFLAKMPCHMCQSSILQLVVVP